MAERHHEDAVEQFLRAGARERALRPRRRRSSGVVERLDFAVAERWLRDAVAVAARRSGRSPWPS